MNPELETFLLRVAIEGLQAELAECNDLVTKLTQALDTKVEALYKECIRGGTRLPTHFKDDELPF